MSIINTETQNLTISDCDKFLFLAEFLEDHMSHSLDLGNSFYTKIPLKILTGYGFTVLDIEKFSNIIDRKIIASSKDLEQVDNVDNYVTLKNGPMHFTNIKKELNTVKDYLISKNTLTKKNLENNIKPKICIDLRGEIFAKQEKAKKPIKISDKKLLLLKILSNKKPKTIYLLRDEAGYQKEQSVSKAISAINKSFISYIGENIELIVLLGSGYGLNTSFLDISITNKNHLSTV